MKPHLTIQEVARRESISCRHVQRKCEASCYVGAFKKNGCWNIPRESLPRILQDKRIFCGEDTEALNRLPRPVLEEALRKLGVIKDFRKFTRNYQGGRNCRTRARNAYCQERGIGASTLQRWIKQFEDGGLMGLVDTRKIDREGGMTMTHEAWELFKTLYLDPRKPSVNQCWLEVKQINKSEGRSWNIPCMATMHKYIQKYIPYESVVMGREGGEAWDAKCGPYIESDPDSVAPGELWVGDHHQFNCMIWHRGQWVRPWITAWLDWCSRVLMGWCISVCPNQNTILMAMRHALLTKRHGIPGLQAVSQSKSVLRDRLILIETRDFVSRQAICKPVVLIATQPACQD